MMESLVFSGIQPTGQLTLGNYLGALKNWAHMQRHHDCIYCVVDQHAITVFQDPVQLKNATREVAAGIIASGVHVDKTILFYQSANPNHTELAWYFNCIARMGWVNRMTQFKEKSGENAQNSSVGLFAYPVLQAADVLAYKATHVPVGEDQKQHLELCRDIAQKFNHDYNTDFFPLIEPLIRAEGARVMSLKNGNKKMSKSDPSDNARINLTDGADVIAKKIKKATSDSHLLPCHTDGLHHRPEAKNLITLYAVLQDKTIQQVMPDVAGKGWGTFKNMLADVAVATIAPIGVEMNRLMQDKGEIDRILQNGAHRARHISQPIVDKTRKIIGFL